MLSFLFLQIYSPLPFSEKQYNQQIINGEELIFTEEDLIAIKNDLKNLKEYEKKVKK